MWVGPGAASSPRSYRLSTMRRPAESTQRATFDLFIVFVEVSFSRTPFLADAQLEQMRGRANECA